MHKNILPLLALSLCLVACGKNTSSSLEPSETTTPPTTTIVSSTVDIDSKADVNSWAELKPYLQFALGDYYAEVPSFSVRSYHVSFQTSEDIVGVQIDCLNLQGESGEDTYADILEEADYTVVTGTSEVPYAYKMLTDFDCMYISFLQDGSTLSILAYYQTVRVPDWPTELSDLIVGKDMPKLKADAYYYYYQVNARNFITFYIDCYFKESTNSLNTYINTLTKVGYSLTNQSGFYTAISPQGDIVINFDDYYGDGTCIEIAAYSYWPSIDFVNYFGFDLPRYEGLNSGFETQYLDINGNSYICIFYDNVESLCLEVYGEQLLKAGFTLDTTFVSEISKVYYLESALYEAGSEPFVQIAYNASDESMVIAVPFTYTYVE